MPGVPRAAVVAAVLGTALAYMSDDMLNLAIPSVARDLGATMTDVQWILDAYYVPLVGLVLIAGSVGDIAGHRRVFAAGLLLFMLGALTCAASPAIPWLVLGRGLQGVAAALLLTAGLALVTRLTPAEKRPRAIGLYLGLVAAVPAIGPFLSGLLVDLLSWRWLFLAPLVLPIAALGLTWVAVPETPTDADRRVDVLGGLVGLVTLAVLSVALIAAGSGDSRWGVIVPAMVAVVSAVTFVVVEQHSPDPMLPWRLGRDRAFLVGNAIWLVAAMTSWVAVFLLALTLQVTLGLRPAVAGATLVPIYVVMVLGSPLAGRIAERTGPAPPILVGLGLYAAGLWLLSGIGAGSKLVPDVLSAILVFAIGMTTFTAPLATVTLGALDDADQGIASGVNNAMGQLAGLLAIVVLPFVIGPGGMRFGDPAFAAGSVSGLRLMALVALAALGLAAATFGRRPARAEPKPAGA
jgi:EmrB/QacA subfamily drug resistance transporter